MMPMSSVRVFRSAHWLVARFANRFSDLCYHHHGFLTPWDLPKYSGARFCRCHIFERKHWISMLLRLANRQRMINGFFSWRLFSERSHMLTNDWWPTCSTGIMPMDGVGNRVSRAG